MEQTNNKNNNNSLIVFMIIAILLLCGVICYLIFNLGKENPNVENNNDNNVVDQGNNDNASNKDENQNDEGDNITEEDNNKIVKVEFKDLNLCTYFALRLKTECKKDDSNYIEITQDAIDSVISVHYEDDYYQTLIKVKNLKGIENFKNITRLATWTDDLSVLTSLTNLETLHLHGETVTNIND